MTNREWLESLSDEKLAKFLYNLSKKFFGSCEICSSRLMKCIENKEECPNGIRKWLKAEHKEQE